MSIAIRRIIYSVVKPFILIVTAACALLIVPLDGWTAGTVSVSPTTVIVGNSTTATWSGFTGNVNVKVYKGSTFFADANTNLSGASGSQSLNTTGWEPRTDYRIGIELRSTPYTITYSSNFTVNAKTGTVSVSPTTVIVGSSTTATWSGFTGNVNVKVYKGSTFFTDANTNLSGASGSQSLNTT
ncbi:MAG: hypothetical protein JZU65_06910, partial [Chlorobium sp.]|nr:hypothetical protein [Chlorobium sp.]